jgi:hypothetical protein
MHMVLSTPADTDLRGWKIIGGSALPRGLAAAASPAASTSSPVTACPRLALC